MNKIELANKILAIDGLTNDEKSALIELLRKQKKYGLVWEDKPEDVEERLREELPVLTEVKERAIISDDKDAPNHILIEGDNLEALTALTYTHEGKVDVIYIDPPYNTGSKDFIYNDSFVDKEDCYRHSKWLSFMNKRLKIAKQLLSTSGLIFISIDDNELAQLIMLCNEIFGEDNFINNISINMNSLSGVKMTHTINGKRYPAQKESLLLYRKTNLPLSLSIEKTQKGKWDKEYNLIIPEMKSGDFELFDQMSVDDINQYLSTKSLISINSYAKENRINLDEDWLWQNSFRIFGSKSNRPLAKRNKDTKYNQQIICYLNNDGNRRYFRSDYNRETKDPRIELVRAESNSSVFLSDNWTDISNDGGVAQEGGVIYPNGKKPLFLIQRILRATNIKDAIILDFFAGSGTTLHATVTLNKDDDGNRRCILVQNKEKEKNVSESITYKRCQNVISGYNSSMSYDSNSLRYYKTDFVFRDQSPKNMRALVAASTDLLCIKNDIYTEVPFAGKKLNNKVARYFEGVNKRMLVIYDERAISAIVELLQTVDIEPKIKVYLFAPSRYAFDDEFVEVMDRVELCALPAAIYDAYQKVLPKRRPKYLNEALESNTKATQTDMDFSEKGSKQ